MLSVTDNTALVIYLSALAQHGATRRLKQLTRLTLADLNWCVFECWGGNNRIGTIQIKRFSGGHV